MNTPGSKIQKLNTAQKRYILSILKKEEKKIKQSEYEEQTGEELFLCRSAIYCLESELLSI